MAIGITGANNGYSRPASDSRFFKLSGGELNGNLTVVGAISASQYLGIPGGGGGVSGDYLPLSGGTLTGPLIVASSTDLNGVISPYYSVGFNGDTITTTTTSKTWSYPLTPAYTPGTMSGVGLFFKDDGTTMYILDNTGNIFEYSFPDWDITSATYINSYDLNATGTLPSPRGLYFSPDGLNLFATNFSGLTINRYTLMVPWDVTSIYSTPDQSESLASLPGISIVTGPYGLYFNPDGTKYFFINNKATDFVVEVTLATPWDLTSTLDAIELNISAFAENNGRSLTFNGDGSKMYLYGLSNGAFYEFDLGTQWSIASVTLANISYISNGVDPASAVFYSGSNYKMFYYGAGDGNIHIVDNVDPNITVADLFVSETLTANYITEVNTGAVTADTVTADTVYANFGITAGSYINSASIESTGISRAGDTSYFTWGNSSTKSRIYSDTTNSIRFRNSTNGAFADIAAANITSTGTVSAANITATTVNCNGTLNMGNNQTILWAGGGTQGIQGFSGRLVFGFPGEAIRMGGPSGGIRASNYQVGGSADAGTASITSPLSAVIKLGDSAGTNFNRLQFGGSTDAFPAIARNGSGLDIRFASLTGDLTDLRARNITSTGYSFSGYPTMNLYANSNSVFIQCGTGTVRFFNGSIRASQLNNIGFSGNVTGGMGNDATINWVSFGVLGIGAGEGAGRTDGSLRLTNLSAVNITASGTLAGLNLVTGGAPISATSSLTLALSDIGRVIRYSGTPAISATVPQQSAVAWPDGSMLYLRRNTGAGTITIQGTGVIINDNTSSSVPIGSMMAIRKVTTDEWDFI